MVTPLMLFGVLSGCSAPPEAPSDLDSLMGFVFAHADRPDDDAFQLALANLSDLLDEGIDQTLDGYQVRTLAPAVIEEMGSQTGSSDALVGAAVGHVSDWPADWLGTSNAIGDDHDLSVPVDPLNGRVYLTDAECFRQRMCDALDSEQWASDDLPLLITARVHWIQQWRRVEMQAGTAMVQRWWIDRPIDFNINFLKVHRQYYLFVFLPRETGGSVSMQATWIQAEISGAPVPVGTALSLVVDSMKSTASGLDSWVASMRGAADPDGAGVDSDDSDDSDDSVEPEDSSEAEVPSDSADSDSL